MESVGLAVQPQNPLQTISQILQIKSAQMSNESQSRQLQEQRAIAGVDWSQFTKPDGTIDADAAAQAALKASPTFYGPERAHQIRTLANDQIATKKGQQALNEEQRADIASTMTAIAADPEYTPDKLIDAADRLKEQNDNPDVRRLINVNLKHILAMPIDQQKQALLNIGRGSLGAGEVAGAGGIATPQVGTIGTGGGTQLIQQKPLAPGGIKPQGFIPNTLGPGEQDQVVNDQLGNPYRVLRDARGNISGVSAVPQSGNAGPATFGVGERRALEEQANTNFANVNANRTAATMAPQQLDQIDKALELSKSVPTGKWAAERGSIESGLATIIPGFQGARDDATKLQLLDKFSERIAADASKVLGSNTSTDAARESIHKQNANVGYTPEAVQSVLKYAKAQTLAMQAKGNAQETWLKQSGNGITKQHEFETVWRKAYDPVIFQLEAADPAEKREIIQKLSPAEAASLASKRKELKALGAM